MEHSSSSLMPSNCRSHKDLRKGAVQCLKPKFRLLIRYLADFDSDNVAFLRNRCTLSLTNLEPRQGYAFSPEKNDADRIAEVSEMGGISEMANRAVLLSRPHERHAEKRRRRRLLAMYACTSCLVRKLPVCLRLDEERSSHFILSGFPRFRINSLT